MKLLAFSDLHRDHDQAKSLVYAQSSTGGSAALYFGLLRTSVTPDDKNPVDNVSPGVL